MVPEDIADLAAHWRNFPPTHLVIGRALGLRPVGSTEATRSTINTEDDLKAFVAQLNGM